MREILLDGHNFDSAEILEQNKASVCLELICPFWYMIWPHGTLSIGKTTEPLAREAAAMFISLWNIGVEFGLAKILMQGYLAHLEAQGVNNELS